MIGMHGIIFSYEKPAELGELITHRVQGSIPFAGDYRMIDFILSDLVNAGVDDVGVIMHGKCQSLLDHLGSGKSWDLSRNYGGLKLLPSFAAHEDSDGRYSFRGKMEALASVRGYLQHIRQDYVVLCDSDLAVNLPLKQMLEDHIASGADITCACSDRHGDSNDVYFTLDKNRRITDVAVDLSHPEGWRSLNIYVMKTEMLLQLVEDCAAHNEKYFQIGVLQKHCDTLNLQGWCWQGYEAHIRTVAGYYRRSMELLDPAVRGQLFDASRPIRGKSNDAASTYIDPDGECVNSLISEGCNIQGSVKNCIVFRDVTVEKGAQVENCILFKDAVVRTGATLKYVIADKNVVFDTNVTLLGHENYPIVVAKNTHI